MILLEGEPPLLTPELVGGVIGGGIALVTAAALWARKIWGTVLPLLRRADDRLGEVLHEQKPNHGASMRDSVNRIEALVTQQASEIGALRDDVADMRTSIKRHDRELGRANDLAAASAARATQAERRYDEQLSDHSIRLHHLETRKENPS